MLDTVHGIKVNFLASEFSNKPIVIFHSRLISQRNSIQLVLTTDEIMTFVMYRYKILEWSGPQSLSSPQLPHMETGPATAGVNAGDRMNGFNVTNDPDNIVHLRLVSMSNVGVPGLFIYRIDLGTSKTHKSSIILCMAIICTA